MWGLSISVVMHLGALHLIRRGIGLLDHKGIVYGGFICPTLGGLIEEMEVKTTFEGLRLAVVNHWQDIIVECGAECDIGH